MARVNFSTISFTDPPWIGDELSRHTVLPGGARVKKQDWSVDSTTGNRVVKSGSILMRRIGSKLFQKATNDLTTKQSTVLTADVSAGSTVLNVQVADFQAADTLLITDGGATSETATVSSVDFLAGTVTLSAGTTNAYTSGDTVELNSATSSADMEVFLLVHEIPDANILADAELYRHNSLVRINWLPDWDSSTATLQSTTVDAKIRDLYACIMGNA